MGLTGTSDVKEKESLNPEIPANDNKMTFDNNIAL